MSVALGVMFDLYIEDHEITVRPPPLPPRLALDRAGAGACVCKKCCSKSTSELSVRAESREAPKSRLQSPGSQDESSESRVRGSEHHDVGSFGAGGRGSEGRGPQVDVES
eukprot:2389843-Rhodomonas_salina.1